MRRQADTIVSMMVNPEETMTHRNMTCTVCGCVCDTAALGCGPTFQADPNACACVCQPDCGGCPVGQTCNQTICACLGGIN